DSQDLSHSFYVSVDTDERQLLFRQVVSGADGSYATEGGRVKYDVYDELGTPLTVMQLSKSGLKLSGDLEVTGDTTTLSASSITISDKNILLAEGVTSRSLLDGAGISLGEEDAERSITYSYSTDSLHFNSPITILHEGSSATYGSRELSLGGSRLTSGQLEVGSAVLTGDQLSLGDLLLKQQEIVLGEVTIGEHGVEVLGTSLGNASVSVGAYALSSDGLTTGDPDVHLSTSGLHVGATVSLAGSGLQVGSYE
ncbi:unnamed protein product, partial [Chrysoparadoxa australica]